MSEQVIQYRDDLKRAFGHVIAWRDVDASELFLVAVWIVRGEEELLVVNADAPLHRWKGSSRRFVLPALPCYSDPAWRSEAACLDSIVQFCGGVDELWFWGVWWMGFGRRQWYTKMLDLRTLHWLTGNAQIEEYGKDQYCSALDGAKETRRRYEAIRAVPSGVWGHKR